MTTTQQRTVADDAGERFDQRLFDIRTSLRVPKQLAAIIKQFLALEFVSHNTILTVAKDYGRCSDLTPGYSRIVIWRVRQRLPKGVRIERLGHDGYYMTRVSKAILLAAISH